MKNTIFNIQSGKVLVPTAPRTETITIERLQVLAAFLQIMEENGYALDQDLLGAISRLDAEQMKGITAEIVETLKNLSLGKKFQCMYRGFPKSVMSADAAILWFGANLHYWSNGKMRLALDGNFETRPSLKDKKYRVLGLMKPQEKNRIIADLVYAQTVWTPDQKEWILANLSAEALQRMLNAKERIPNHTNSAVLAAKFLHKDIAKRLVRTQTDVLRLAAVLFLDDPMLEKKEAFRKAPRAARKRLMELLDGVTHGSEDMRRYESYWKRLSSAIHPAEYPQYESALKAFQQLWNGELNRSYYSRLEQSFKNHSLDEVLSLLNRRPGEFTRALSRVLHQWTDPKSQQWVIYNFLNIIRDVDTPKLISVIEYMMNFEMPYRVFAPRGGRAPYCIEKPNAPIPENVKDEITAGITRELLRRFAEREPLGKVYIDPALRGLCIPKGQTTTSDQFKAIARGSHIKLSEETNVIRAFVFWQNVEVGDTFIRTDIDLSAVIYDENWSMIEHISYMNLRGEYAYHSGDIIDAPNGAAEYIDVDLRKIADSARYILFPANVFSGPVFRNIQICSAGWMERKELNSGEIWEPSTVENQFSINANTRAVSMFAFDVKTREIIWIARQSSSNFGGLANNVLTRQMAQFTAIRAEIERKRMSLYNLFLLHVQARGDLVEQAEDADYKIMLGGDVNPYDLAVVAGEWI